MDTSQPVQTGLEGRNCRYCDQPLPDRPTAKEHRFCNPKCRAAWHRKQRQLHLDRALARVQEARGILLDTRGDQNVSKVLGHAYTELRAAGAEAE